ncbi:MAG TPA: hypothetical protein VJG90_02110 [Candidatus Nanoarchaeia archaeon]|nr:hypothetical protein [Candidatus Nanoarchaeia archaeon]
MAKSRKKNIQDSQNLFSSLNVFLLVVVVLLLLFNQYSLHSLSVATGLTKPSYRSDDSKLKSADLSKITSTAQSIQMLMPVEEIKDAQSAMAAMIPQGMPEYGQAAGVTYDNPVAGLSRLVQLDRSTQLTPEQHARYASLASKPYGISCEYCCGIGPAGADENGKSRCGCKHNPALLGLTKWLIQNTDYSDARIVQEALKWKSLFFPKQMVALSLKVAGGDPATLKDLPGMVGGC